MKRSPTPFVAIARSRYRPSGAPSFSASMVSASSGRGSGAGPRFVAITDADYDDAELPLERDLLLNHAHQFPSLHIEVRARERERVLRVELLTQPLDRRPHPHQRHAVLAELRQQPRLGELAPGNDLLASRINADDGWIDPASAGMALDLSPRSPSRQPQEDGQPCPARRPACQRRSATAFILRSLFAAYGAVHSTQSQRPNSSATRAIRLLPLPTPRKKNEPRCLHGRQKCPNCTFSSLMGSKMGSKVRPSSPKEKTKGPA